MAETEQEYQQKLTELKSTIQSLKAELDTTKNSRDELQNSLQSSEEKIATLLKKIESIKEALDREKKSLAQLSSRSAELEQHQEQQQQQLLAIIRQMYQLGQNSQVKLLLKQQSPEKISRLRNYHSYISVAHQQKIQHYTDTLSQLKQLSDDKQQTTNRLEKQLDELARQERTLKQTQEKRLTALKAIKRSLKEKDQQLATLQEDRKYLQELLEAATNTLSELRLPKDAKPFASTKGALTIPTAGHILHKFNSPQFEGKMRRNGIFIGNKAGAPVASIYHGRVIFSDYLRGHGLLLIIDHGDGYMSLYGHNQTLLKETGDWASTGEIIATVGNSGGQEQTGLYFEIRHSGQPQNPQTWLRRS